jgi:5'-phosphate synthase pdxT subunit
VDGRKIRVGVLALQGDFAKHIAQMQSLGVEVQEVRMPEELHACHGLIIPGGESTVMHKLLDFMHMQKALLQFAEKKPIFGTCAGLILMAKTVKNSFLDSLNLLDITVERNAFGRQIDSFQIDVQVNFSESGPEKTIQACFIRAPRIVTWGKSVKILSELEKEPVLVQEGHHLGASFHPELTNSSLIHAYFLQIIQKSLVINY